MGYRSTMVLGVPKEKEKDLLKLNLNSGSTSVKDLFETADCFADDVAVFRGEYLKWYDEYLSAIDRVKENKDTDEDLRSLSYLFDLHYYTNWEDKDEYDYIEINNKLIERW